MNGFGCCGITRRGFLAGAGFGLAAGIPLGWLALKGKQALEPTPFTGRTHEEPRAEFAMPGRYPGRVTEVQHQGAVRRDFSIDASVVHTMLHRGMCDLTGAYNDPATAWRTFFSRDDVVGIKVNPVGRKRKSDEGWRVESPDSISSPALVIEIVKALKNEVGMSPRNILVFERYADEFRTTGYEDMIRERDMAGVRWYASAHAYDDMQLDITGQHPNQHRDPHVVGYDPDVFVSMGFAPPGASPRDDRRFRSHLSLIVTKMVNKIITLPVLKDHRSAGVTLALKNMSHGMNNNVCRSHIGGVYRLGGATSGPNQCNTFIPTAVAQPVLRQKATLHIMDGLIGVYEGGPGNWNRTWATWVRNSLFFATDPVAMDHVGWHIIDEKRAEEGYAPVGHMGQIQGGDHWSPGPRLAALAAQGTPEAAALFFAEQQRMRNLTNNPLRLEQFDRRQPEHVVLAGTLGLGRFAPAEIEHRAVSL